MASIAWGVIPISNMSEGLYASVRPNACSSYRTGVRLLRLKVSVEFSG